MQAAFASLPPDVSVGPDKTVAVNQPLAIQGTTASGGQLNGLGLLVLWTKVSGPGTVTFGNATSPATTAQFSSVGNYVLRLTVSDGVLNEFDELNVLVA